MNPTEPVWTDFVTDWSINHYIGRWCCDIIYQDVMGCGTVGRSFDLRRNDHGHVFAGANMALARRLYEAGRQTLATFALTAEGKSEQVTRWAIGMTSNAHYGWIQLDPHRYTHPDHLLVLGGANGGWTQPFHNAQLAFLYGVQHDLILSQDVNLIREVVALRIPFTRYVTRGTYRDVVGLDFTGEDLSARRFDRFRDARAITVCVINPKQVANGTVTVDVAAFNKEEYAAFWFLAGGSARRATGTAAGNDRVRFAVPRTHTAALLLVAKPAPGEELVSRIVSQLEPGGARAGFWVANLAAQPRSAKIEITAPDLAPTTRKIEVPARDLIVDAVAWSAGDKLVAGGDTTLTLDGRAASQSYLYPLIEDGGFEKMAPVTEGTPFEGRSFLRLGPKDAWNGHGITLRLRPNCRYRIELMGRRTGADGKGIFALVRMKSAAQGWQHVGLNFPPDIFDSWVKMSADFTAPADLTEADIYLYNNESRETVDYDALKLEQLPTAAPAR